ncbi:MAG TPA: type I 3-dehydroquinate dehydratase [Pyrinomonadaceae bacterium]|jgi:3-dehydroquinate dehydratase/shikimate dehydrogenase
MDKTTLAATLMTRPSPNGEELQALPCTVEWLEVRADLVGDLDADWLRNHFGGKLLYTLRSRAEGGAFSGPPAERHARLLKAGREYELVDLEDARDNVSELLAGIPAAKRLVSWHGAAADVAALQSRCAQLSATAARYYRIVPTAAQAGDELAPLALLKSLGRSDVIAYADGQVGFWSRLVAPRLGSPCTFGAVTNGRNDAGLLPVARLITDYGLPELTPATEIYGIVGNPVAHSLSPCLHNASYRALAHPALFVPFHVESFPTFWRAVVLSRTLDYLGFSIRGLTVASPHKETAIAEAGSISRMVARAGSTNLFIRHNGVWQADTTDPAGVVAALRERAIRIEQKRAAVVGCGGAGRAISAALEQAGARVTMVNRGPERGRHAVRLLHLPFVPLADFNVAGYDVVVNATPVGRDDGALPFGIEDLSAEAVVVDLVYGAKPTPLAAGVRARGQVMIDGREVLLTQVLRQFRLMTNMEMPVSLARQKLGWEPEPTELATAV